MKIAIATDFHSPWVGGPATFVDNFSAFLVSRDHQVEILAPSATGRASVERSMGKTVHRFESVSLPFGYGVRAVWRLDRVVATLRRIRPDVVQIHHPFPLGSAAMIASRRLGIPIVAVNHTIPECSLYGLRGSWAYPIALAAFQRYLIWLLARASAICTPTRTAADLLREMGVRRPVEVISNGIDTSRFTPSHDKSAARRKLGLPDKPMVLYTGRLDAEKDMETWLRAGAVLLKSANAQLVVGGEGADKPRLQGIARRLGLDGSVTFPGYLPVDQLPSLYQAADVYFITSAVELQSITTLEALATGLPVVAADAAALPELVAPGTNGFLAKPGDVGSFGAALIRIVHSVETAERMGAAGRRIAERHSLLQVAACHEQLLERVATRRHAAETTSA